MCVTSLWNMRHVELEPISERPRWRYAMFRKNRHTHLEVLLIHKLAYPLCKEFLDLQPQPRPPACRHSMRMYDLWGFSLTAQRHENYSDKPGCMQNVWAPPTAWCLVGHQDGHCWATGWFSLPWFLFPILVNILSRLQCLCHYMIQSPEARIPWC